jgi:type VI secretion system protein ImpF
MAAHDELFWPSLYSRLVPSRYGDGDAVAYEASDEDEAFGLSRHFVDFETLRRQVETEPQSLLNATSLEATLAGAKLRGGPSDELPRSELPFHNHPHVRASIVNYGLPAFIGHNVYTLSLHDVRTRLRNAILAFEPRIREDTIRVEVEAAPDGKRIAPDKGLHFTIEGEIYGLENQNLRVRIDTTWDPDKIGTGVRAERVGG